MNRETKKGAAKMKRVKTDREIAVEELCELSGLTPYQARRLLDQVEEAEGYKKIKYGPNWQTRKGNN